MSIKRIFFDWSRPALPQVVQLLLSQRAGQSPIDLSDLVVVFPGKQAGRRFLELLALETDGELAPPKILTVGALPEQLYTPKRPFASTLTQRLAWSQALQRLPRESLRIIAANPPEERNLEGWLRLGDLLRRQHTELAADLFDFADVAKYGKGLPGFNEGKRWKILATIEKEYLSILDGLSLWDQQTARLRAVEFRECQTEHDILLVGTVDLNKTMRAMLNQVSDRVTACIHAPPEWQDRFDEHGCVLSDKWADESVHVAADQVQVVEDSVGQTQAVVTQLSAMNGRFAIDEITVAVPDEKLAIPLQRTLGQWGVPSHWPVQRQLSASEPYRFLMGVADFLDGKRSDQFAALIRHPDVGAWLTLQEFPPDWLTHWDKNYNSHLSPHVENYLDGSPSGRIAHSLVTAIELLLHPLKREAAPLSHWCAPVLDVLLKLYGDLRVIPTDSRSRQLAEACAIIQKGFLEHHHLPPSLDPPVKGSVAIRLTLESLAAEILPHPQAEGTIALSGWLDLPLDDAPAVIITSFNEGLIPSSLNHDQFLPNRLRSHLGLEDNARRYARDCHALMTILHSRELVQLIVARRNGSGESLFPSRLLFATRPEEIAQRVVSFYSPGNNVVFPLPPCLQPSPEAKIAIPRPRPLTTPRTVFRVTEFRDYLASPYRYYLRHLLRLGELTDQLDELDAAAFGTLLHEVLKQFGEGPHREARHADSLFAVLDESLNRIASETYGNDPLPTIRIQIEQSRHRLRSFAEWQAAWREAGWQIHSIERDAVVPLTLLDGRRIQLKGRIDRIDYHPDSGRWAIFDYKTGDAGLDPNSTHRKRDQWCDLQLPLYRHLAAGVTGHEDVDLGYIVLPRNNMVSHRLAPWSIEDLADADDVARKVAADILDEKFWVELSQPPATLSEFGPICQDGVFGQEAVV
ncbi:PD-(D/E)XK nuclease family protein [Planctomicrobium sp. SH664]|uniref:PD-(D/E)XK nuclease family protein n=1 Tax=Planctomicrobium sp. SH664 TaxID=3448125 RepID=UPI003F5BACA1